MSSNGMFVLIAIVTSTNTTCSQATLEQNSQLWHNRMRHLSYVGLKFLVSKQMVNGLPSITTPQDLCTHCLVGKKHRNVMSKRSLWRALKKLQLVHANLYDPIRPSSSSNKKYFLSFINDMSRKTWVYFLSEKAKTFSFFKVSKQW